MSECLHVHVCLHACRSMFACPSVLVRNFLYHLNLLVPVIPASNSTYPCLHVDASKRNHIKIGPHQNPGKIIYKFTNKFNNKTFQNHRKTSLPPTSPKSCNSMSAYPWLRVHTCIAACPCLNACMSTSACPCVHGCISAWCPGLRVQVYLCIISCTILL